MAVFCGHLKVVKFLVLDANASVDLANKGSVGSALCLASSDGHLEVVKFLVLEGNAPVELDWNGRTALDLAVAAGHIEIVRFIVLE